MMASMKESCSPARQEDDQRKSTAQQTMQNITDFLRRVIVPIEGQGGVTLSYVCCYHRYPRDGYTKWVSTGHGDGSKSKKKGSVTSGARLAAASTIGGTRTVSLFFRTARTVSEAKVFRAHGPQGCVRESRERSPALGEPAVGRCKSCVQVLVPKNKADEGCAQKVHHGEPRGGENR